MKRVLVTGASGFIGTHLVAELVRRGYDVRAFSRKDDGDIRDAEAVGRAIAGCDTVIHLAAKVHDLSSRSDDPAQFDVTLNGTRVVVDAAVANGVKRLVFLSTLAVYGTSESVQDESTPVAPSSSYGAAKLECERIVREAPIESVILRPAMVYGRGCKGNLPRLVRAIRRPLFAIPGGKPNRRSLLHIDNLVQAIVLAATRPEAAGRTYIVTDAADYSTEEMVRLIARAVGRRAPIVRIPRFALRLAALAGDALGRIARRRMPFDSIVLDKLTGSQFFSSAKIARELGYAPARDFASSAGDVTS